MIVTLKNPSREFIWKYNEQRVLRSPLPPPPLSHIKGVSKSTTMLVWVIVKGRNYSYTKVVLTHCGKPGQSELHLSALLSLVPIFFPSTALHRSLTHSLPPQTAFANASPCISAPLQHIASAAIVRNSDDTVVQSHACLACPRLDCSTPFPSYCHVHFVVS